MKHWHGVRKRYENKRYSEQWMLGFQPLEEGQNCAKLMEQPNVEDFILLEPPAGIFYADPFLTRVGDKIFCFFEESAIDPVFGWISMVVIDLQGRVTEQPRKVLGTGYHLSYPQVFSYQDRWFMLPETSANGTIELWVAESFPDQWRQQCVLVNDIPAADATLHHDGEYWWLFAAVKQDCRKFGNKLFVWYARDLMGGNWTPHPENPVRESLLYDRPAGELFKDGERLIRPVQDSVKRYGGAVEFREVDALSTKLYREHQAARLEFPRETGFAGVHTVNSCEGMAVIDLLRLVRKQV